MLVRIKIYLSKVFFFSHEVVQGKKGKKTKMLKIKHLHKPQLAVHDSQQRVAFSAT